MIRVNPPKMIRKAQKLAKSGVSKEEMYNSLCAEFGTAKGLDTLSYADAESKLEEKMKEADTHE